MFGQEKHAIEESNGGGGKYITFGNQQLTITGFDIKPSKQGDKHQISLLVETPAITTAGFKPDEKAIYGGKIGKIQMSIYIDFSTMNQGVKDFEKQIQTIAKKLNVYEEACAVKAATVGEYLDKIKVLFKGKYAWFTVSAKVYAHEEGRDKYTLVLPRFGYVSEKEEGLKPFDKNNKYMYMPMKEADSPTENVTTTEASPW